MRSHTDLEPQDRIHKKFLIKRLKSRILDRDSIMNPNLQFSIQYLLDPSPNFQSILINDLFRVVFLSDNSSFTRKILMIFKLWVVKLLIIIVCSKLNRDSLTNAFRGSEYSKKRRHNGHKSVWFSLLFYCVFLSEFRDWTLFRISSCIVSIRIFGCFREFISVLIGLMTKN